MKPTMQSEKEVVTSPAVFVQHSKAFSKACSKKRLIIGGMIGVLVLAVVIGAVLGAVYLGSEIAEENYKAAWITYNSNQLKEPITEKVVVTDREEDVTNPGVVRVIVDYQSKRLVTQYNGPLEGDKDATCFVSDMEDYERDIDIKEVRESITGLHMNVNAELTVGHNYTATEEEVDFDTLSPRAQEMCIGVDLVKVKPFYGSMTEMESTKSDRKKRSCIEDLICSMYCRLRSSLKLSCTLRCISIKICDLRDAIGHIQPATF